ncbi:MAG: 50S ribosomal protein L25 [Planctomycetota bacterium]|nr:50S ribosomal protein L25 [Planctomycetota bacterium]
MEFIQIEVSQRDALGTANANRIRREGNIPAVLYGMQKRNLSLTIAQTEVDRFLRTGSHLVELRLGDQVRPAILREMQVDATTDEILHIDFNRVDQDVEVETDIPVNFKGHAAGEREGGVFQTLENTVSVRARPGDLPSEYLIDISEMALGDSVTVGSLEERPGVTLTQLPETVIAQVTMPKAVAEEPAEGEVAEGEAAEGEAAPAEEPAAE